MGEVMVIDLTLLSSATDRLAEGLARHHLAPTDAQLRDGLIQRFEFTYDLAHKMLRRALAINAAEPNEIERLSFGAMIRSAWAEGLTGHEWAEWKQWRDMRNITSHTYHEQKARDVVASIPDFLIAARDVLIRIPARA